MGGLEDRVASVRRFSRFYTRKIGVLHEGLLGSPLSLAEGRVIWELAQRERATASELAAELGLDSGYCASVTRGDRSLQRVWAAAVGEGFRTFEAR